MKDVAFGLWPKCFIPESESSHSLDATLPTLRGVTCILSKGATIDDLTVSVKKILEQCE